MFVNQPVCALIMSLIYVSLAYSLVMNEKNLITYIVTVLASLMQLTFLYLWYQHITFLLNNVNIELSIYLKFSRFVDLAYLALFIPLLILVAWYGLRKIIERDTYFFLKIIIAIVYLTILFGVLVFGALLFPLLYYGFAL